jgi:hypothetical protein
MRMGISISNLILEKQLNLGYFCLEYETNRGFAQILDPAQKLGRAAQILGLF